ncbi:MAG: DUF2189 domain-containing protein [Alphaproteobacteria bacterium]
MSVTDTGAAAATPRLRALDMDQPWRWLAAGWRDLWASPGIGLAYGLVFAVLGAGLTWLVLAQQVYYLTFPLMAGFLLVGPVAVAGLYLVSRRRQRGEPVAMRDALAAFGRNPVQLGLVGVVLLLINIAWVRFAALLFMLFFSDSPPPVDPMGFLAVVLQVDSIPFFIVGFAIGGVLAAIVFAICAISIPMLVDRPETSAFTAIVSSWQVVWRNKGPMALWAWLIVLFIGAGIATGFVGLIVTLPLIGHATWAAYRDSVDWSEQP